MVIKKSRPDIQELERFNCSGPSKVGAAEIRRGLGVLASVHRNLKDYVGVPIDFIGFGVKGLDVDRISRLWL